MNQDNLFESYSRDDIIHLLRTTRHYSLQRHGRWFKIIRGESKGKFFFALPQAETEDQVELKRQVTEFCKNSGIPLDKRMFDPQFDFFATDLLSDEHAVAFTLAWNDFMFRDEEHQDTYIPLDELVETQMTWCVHPVEINEFNTTLTWFEELYQKSSRYLKTLSTSQFILGLAAIFIPLLIVTIVLRQPLIMASFCLALSFGNLIVLFISIGIMKKKHALAYRLKPKKKRWWDWKK